MNQQIMKKAVADPECVCVCGEGGGGRGERERGVGRGLDPPLKFKYLLELSTHEIDTR